MDTASASVAELLSTYREILRELRGREVLRTNNAPTGDYAEFLIAAHFRGKLAPNSEKSWDVKDKDGDRLQVKARVSDSHSDAGTRQLSAIRTWDFDRLIVVLFADDYSIFRAVDIPVSVAESSSKFVEHVNGHRLMATDRFLAGPKATDITEALQRTQRRL